MSSSSSSSVVKRACDACHRRKVKCIGDGTRPCKNCSSSGLSCTYNAIPQKKGPKGSRAKIISELRETQRLAAQKHGIDSPPESPAYSRRPQLLSMELIGLCVDFFFTNLYPTQPILDRSKVGKAISQMATDTEAYVFIVSLCAYMCIQPNLVIPDSTFDSLEMANQPSLHLGQTLLQEALRVRKSLNYENHTVWSVVTSFFFFGSYFCLDRHNLAWFHVREATTLSILLNMHDESSYKPLDAVDSSHTRRLYWLLFVTERAYALQQHRPLSLHATINLPSLDEDPAESAELSGFIHLVTLFRPFDDTFVGLWNKARSGVPTGDWLKDLQRQLSDALPVYLDCYESQAVDLRLSQSWLKTMVWQLSISHGALSSLAADNSMKFEYPIEVSRELVSATNQFSQEAMEVHGIGLVEKLFDVACTLTDVISCVPYEQHSFEFGPRDYLSQIIQVISKLRGGQHRYIPLLASKINETMPQGPNYALSFMPMTDSSRVSEAPRSAAESPHSTPFGSPPLSAVSSQGPGFPSFQQELALRASPSTPSFSNVVMSAGIDYGNVAAFSDPNVYPGSSKFESKG